MVVMWLLSYGTFVMTYSNFIDKFIHINESDKKKSIKTFITHFERINIEKLI